MRLDAGSATINSDMTVTGSGLALTIAQALVDAVTATSRNPVDWRRRNLAFSATTPFAVDADVRKHFELTANGVAAAIVNHLTAHAEVTVTIAPADSGLQRTPNPNNPNTNTQGPATTKTLFGTLT